MTTPNEREYLCFWGKAGGGLGAEPIWHPLAYHSLDVASVADVLLEASPQRLSNIAQLLGTTPKNAKRFIVCLVALHDIGKFSKHFQAKSPEAWQVGPGVTLGRWSAPPSSRHDTDGYDLREALELRALLMPATRDWSKGEFNGIWAGVTGHHGQPRNDNGRPTDLVDGVSPKKCLEPAKTFCRDVREFFDPLVALPEPPKLNLEILSWLLCGLTVVSDWIGSNRAWFPYRPPDLSLAEYWQYAREQAAHAIVTAGVLPSKLASDVSPARLYPDFAASLSPLQQHVRELALPDGPFLTIIEDVTGSGKTEAAVLLAARLMADGRANGLFFALPTMATANAMYDRLASIYGRMFADEATPSLVLGHGKRHLNAKFSESILDTLAPREGYDDGGSAQCASWIADDRRKVFLAEIGIGTIDQALLAVLPSRHQVLRLWGLSDRVLIIDEAHAYDAYMSKEMERQLEFQAALGGSAIVLSATLPEKQRNALGAAFGRGLGAKHAPGTASDYPLVTQVSRSSLSAQPLQSRNDRTRTLLVRRIASCTEAADYVSEMVSRGCAAAWIRNSVDDAIEATAEMRRRGHNPVLLHARFAMGDRLDIERKVCATLGRKDETGKRPGFLVIGTQILEQSLDYDVDAMVTDLAPVDLMIQRAGRLWRHTDRAGRPITIHERKLCVFSPDPDAVASPDWYRAMSARAAAVYGHHGLVWRSAKTLFEAAVIETPGGVRSLVEKVYGQNGLDDIPEPLRKASQDAMGKDGAARSFANANLLEVAKGYGGNHQLWTADTITPTRLGQPVTVFRLGKIIDGQIVPWDPDAHPTRAWALSEVSVNRNRATGLPAPSGAREKLMEAAKVDWPKWEQDMPLLVLEPAEGSVWRGTVVKLGEGEKTVLYDRHVGLRLN